MLLHSPLFTGLSLQKSPFNISDHVWIVIIRIFLFPQLSGSGPGCISECSCKFLFFGDQPLKKYILASEDLNEGFLSLTNLMHTLYSLSFRGWAELRLDNIQMMGPEQVDTSSNDYYRADEDVRSIRIDQGWLSVLIKVKSSYLVASLTLFLETMKNMFFLHLRCQAKDSFDPKEFSVLSRSLPTTFLNSLLKCLLCKKPNYRLASYNNQLLIHT